MADIAIVGAGPAGLATAIALALRKIPVSIFEAKPLPIDKACGEGIMPAGVFMLKKLGVLPKLGREDSSFFNGICFINEKGARAYSDFKDARGLGCRRLALSSALYKRCLDFPSIKFFHEKIRHINFTCGDSVKLIGEETKHDVRLVIGADGLRSRVRAWAELKGEEMPMKRYGLRRHFSIKPWSDHVEVYFRYGVEAYITPCGYEQTNVTFLWNKNQLPLNFENVSFDTMLALFPELARRVLKKTPISEQLAIGPLHQHCREVIADGVALVGDASGYYDAITGEGISIALRQAYSLAHIVKKSKSTMATKKQLLPYVAMHRKIVGAYYRNTGMLLWCAQKPRLMSTLISLGAKKPALFNTLIEASRNSF